MTVQNVTSITNHVGNGIQTSFPFVFKVLDAAWVATSFTNNLTGITLNIDQDNTPGGSAEYSVAPPSGQDIEIQRITPVTQEANYTRYDPFDAETNEDALDKLTMLIQDAKSLIGNLEITLAASFSWEFITFSGDRTLALTDAFKLLKSITSGGTQVVTVPPNVDVAFVKGTQITFYQKGTALLSFVGGSGVTLNVPGLAEVARQFGTVTLIQEEIDSWALLGNLPS